MSKDFFKGRQPTTDVYWTQEGSRYLGGLGGVTRISDVLEISLTSVAAETRVCAVQPSFKLLATRPRSGRGGPVPEPGNLFADSVAAGQQWEDADMEGRC